MLYSPDWLIVAFVVPCLLFVWQKKKSQRREFWKLSLGWWIKLAFSWFFLWVYTAYYPDPKSGDTHKFFDEAKALYTCSVPIENGYRHLLIGNQKESSPVKHCFDATTIWDYNEEISPVNEARTMIRLNLLLFPLSQGSYLFHYFFFCGLAFIGLVLAYRALLRSGCNGLKAWLICFAFPGMMFWTGGILKESLMVFGLGLILHAKAKKTNGMIQLIIGFLLVVLAKWYVGVLAIVFTLLFSLWEKLRWKKTFKVVAIIGIVVFLLGLVNFITERSIPNRIASKRNDFMNLARGGDYWTSSDGKDTLFIPAGKENYERSDGIVYLRKGTRYHHWVRLTDGPEHMAKAKQVALGTCLLRLQPAGSSYAMQRIDGSWDGLLRALPMAFVNGLLRPFPLEGNGKMSMISFLENVLFISLILILIQQRMKSNTMNTRIAFGMLFCLSLVVLAGLITPVSGALVRYRIPGQWIVMVMILWNDGTGLIGKRT